MISESNIRYTGPECSTKDQFHKIFADGTIYCAGTAEGLSDPGNPAENWIVIVGKKAYSPKMHWQNLEVVNSLDGADVLHFFSENILMHYRVNFTPRSPISVEQRVIDVDVIIQNSFYAVAIPNYSWPTK